MKAKLRQWTVQQLVEERAKKAGGLKVNREYQRGAVWNANDMRMLVDSILRGYHIPLIYLRKVVDNSGRTSSEHYDIIDGQQRINAMRSFIGGGVIKESAAGDSTKSGDRFPPLYNPAKAGSKFPLFMQRQKCPWADKTFDGLSPSDKKRFLTSKVAVAIVECDDDEKIVDLFIRLQSGSKLSAQQVRDAWPGEFRDIVVKLGGKENEYPPAPGHAFFTDLMRLRDDSAREAAAQFLMVLLHHWESGGDNTFLTMDDAHLTDCYRKYIVLPSESDEIKRFEKILGIMVRSFAGKLQQLKPPRLNKPEALDLILLADKLLRGGSREWETRLCGTFEKFREEVQRAAEGEMVRYGSIMRGRSQSTADRIRERHDIFMRRMSGLLGVSPDVNAWGLRTPAQVSPRVSADADTDLNLIKSVLVGVDDDDQSPWTVRELMQERDKKGLYPNPDYQRGENWQEPQQKLLIDSVLREYQIPLIYLHKKVDGGNCWFEIIDGQQRINAFREFAKGAMELFDPQKAEMEKTKVFPEFIRDKPCEWAGKRYGALGDVLQNKLLETTPAVVEIECDDDNSARDMFIRLQGGHALSPQQVRDAWPGNFCKLVRSIGGVRGADEGDGHLFFRHLLRTRSADKGEKRQLAAQMLMLFLSRETADTPVTRNIAGIDIDMFYRNNVGMDLESPRIKQFNGVLNEIVKCFGVGSEKKLTNPEAIHLALFSDTLMHSFTPGGKSGIVKAHRAFQENVRRVKNAEEGAIGEGDRDFWDYANNLQSNTVYARIIRPRHDAYVRQMLRLLGDDTKRKDRQRDFTDEQKKIIFARDNGRCWDPKCGGEVSWDDAHFHHVIPHSEGGQTVVENGILMHGDCHRELHRRGPPKGD